MDTELEKIFESVDKEVFTEEFVEKISVYMENTVNKKVEERVALQLESALKEQDEHYTAELAKFQEEIDAEHTFKAAQVVKMMNEDFKSKFEIVIERYEAAIHKTAVKHHLKLVEKANAFFDLYIEKSLPREMIAEAAKNKHAVNVLAEARKALSIDPTMVKESLKTALVDGNKKMESLVKEKVEAERNLAVEKAKRVLSEKTANLPIEKAKWIRARLENKSAAYIAENFDYVVGMYNHSEQKVRRSAMQPNKPVIVDRPALVGEFVKNHTEIQESYTPEPADDAISLYMEGMNFRR